MKLTVSISALLIVFLSSLQAANGQHSGNWELGISGLTGKNFYDRKYYIQTELPPGRETKLKSNYLWAGSLWAERRLGPHLSGIAELRYTEVDVPTNFLCECSDTGSVILQDEKHAWGSLDVGLRYYLNPKSSVSFFAEGRAVAEWLIAAKEKRNDNIYVRWDVRGYSHLVPSVSLAVGAKWKRLAVSFGGNSNAARTIVRDIGIHNKIHVAMKTGILSRGLFAKATFTIFKLH